MADVDNVARVIAAASAIGTACNMAVSYANYQRKRPKASLQASVTTWSMWDEGDIPIFELKLVNRSESPLKIVAVEAQRASSYRDRHTIWQLKTYRRIWRGSRTQDLHPRNDLNRPPYSQVGTLPLTLDPFDRLHWRAAMDGHFWCQYSGFNDGRSVVRALVWLPGSKKIKSSWVPVTAAMTNSTCRACGDTPRGDHHQLTFEDL